PPRSITSRPPRTGQPWPPSPPRGPIAPRRRRAGRATSPGRAARGRGRRRRGVAREEGGIAVSRAIVLLAAGAILLGAPLASAAPSRWAKARHPELEQRESLLAEADALVAKYRHARHVQKDGDGMAAARIYLEKARDLLAEGGAERSRDPTLRYRLAQLQHLLGDDEKALPLLEVLLRDNPPAPIRALAYGDLAVCYARLGRHEDEIKAYGEALKLTPYSTQRATLLANRAEAYMALGDITAAIEGYRASLSGLSSIDMLRGYGVTTLWGLGIALDRSGDLDAGIEALRLARTYAPLDKLIKNENSWFFAPPP